jgi:hypothetical protein
VTVSVAMSARPSAWKNSAAIARILMNFDIWASHFFEILSIKFKFINIRQE